MQRLAAIAISTVVESALMVIVRGYDKPSQLNVCHRTIALTEIVSNCLYVLNCMLNKDIRDNSMQ